MDYIMKGCYGMDKSIIEQLDEEVKSLMEEVAKEETPSEEKVKLLDRIEQLSKIRNERVKIDSEVIDLEAKRKEESRKNEQRIKEDKKNFWSTIIIAVVEIGVPALTYGLWAYASLKFEENGTIRNPVSKNINGRMKATK